MNAGAWVSLYFADQLLISLTQSCSGIDPTGRTHFIIKTMYA